MQPPCLSDIRCLMTFQKTDINQNLSDSHCKCDVGYSVRVADKRGDERAAAAGGNGDGGAEWPGVLDAMGVVLGEYGASATAADCAAVRSEGGDVTDTAPCNCER